MPIIEQHLGGIYTRERETTTDRAKIIGAAARGIMELYEAWQKTPSMDIVLRTAVLHQVKLNMQEWPLKVRTTLFGVRVPLLSNCDELPNLVP